MSTANALGGQADISQRFALDTQGFESLKNQARAGNNSNTLQAAAKQFEAVFTQMVLKSMRDATPSDGLFDNEQTKLYMSMMDQQMSQQQDMFYRRRELVSKLLEHYLNYTPVELGAITDNRRVVEEAFIKGVGVWWHELFSQIGRAHV